MNRRDAFKTMFCGLVAALCPFRPPASRNTVHQMVILGEPTGGYFSVKHIGKALAVLPFSASTEDVRRALGDAGYSVKVSGGALPRNVISIEFQGHAKGKNVPLPLLDWSGLKGGDGLCVVVCSVQVGGQQA